MMLGCDYYSDPAVRARLLEFLGGRSLDAVTAVYITGDDGSPCVRMEPRPAGELWHCLDEGLEVGRSLWDREALIADLDIEYVNFDFPGEPYLEPARAFELQHPVVHALQELLLEHGIVPLHLVSGRGHHFLWKIRRGAVAFRRLARLGHLPPTIEARYCVPQGPTGETIGGELGKAFAGLGMVLEFVAHGLLERAFRRSRIPIKLTAVESEPAERGRELISIDLSEYGDPLFTRAIRMPFSAYLKPIQQRFLLGEDLAENLPPVFVIPLHEMDERDALLVMRDAAQVKELARRAFVDIPDQTRSTDYLISAYTGSPLKLFHDRFYSQEPASPEQWPQTYDRLSLQDLPPCARALLEQPNDGLLKPAGIEHLVRVLTARRWHPRQIAGLIRSKYERDYGWGDLWYRYDAAARADFYVRLFAGLIATGRDSLTSFSYAATHQEHYCADRDGDVNRRTSPETLRPAYPHSSIPQVLR